MKEWHWEKNNELRIYPDSITKGMAKKVWWKCPNGHEYFASVLHRGHGTNCPICNSGRQTSFAEQTIFFYVKKYFPDAINKMQNIFVTRLEFDVFIPSLNMAIEYDGAYWHKKENAFLKERKKFNLCKDKGITLVRIREDIDNLYCENGYTWIKQNICEEVNANSNYIIYADSTGNNKNIKDVLKNLFLVIEKQLMLYKPFKDRLVFDFNLERDKPEILKNLYTNYSESLEKNNPFLTKEWNYEKNNGILPSQVSFNSRIKVWWRCLKCGHEWKTSINLRNKGSGCPKCAVENNKNGKHKEAKKIYQYSLEGDFIREWDCVARAGRELKINASNVAMCALHKRPNAGGYRWEYSFCNKLAPIVKIKKKRTGINSKKVAKCDEYDNIIKIYNSLNEASNELNIDASNISKVINGHQKTAGGYHWKLIEN
jgi:hypothetical protein